MPGLLSQTEKSLHRLKMWLFLFFLLFSLPLSFLLFILMTSAQKEEIAFQRREALRAFNKIQERAQLLFERENKRKFDDYGFFNLAQNTLLKQQAALSFSDLSNPTSEGAFPAVFGYFQYDPDGSFQTPILPEIERMTESEASNLLGEDEYKRRLKLSELLKTKTQPLYAALRTLTNDVDTTGMSPQIVNLPSQQLLPYVKRHSSDQSQTLDYGLNTLQVESNQVRSFPTRIGNLECLPLKSGDLAFVRRAFQQQKVFLQGFAIAGADLVKQVIQTPFLQTELKRDLLLQIRGSAGLNSSIETSGFKQPEGSQVLLFERKLRAPLDVITLQFHGSQSKLGPSGLFLLLLGSFVGGVFCLAMLVFYRLGRGHIALAQERGNFVSAVSHELKTPLTSIRMYAEMLNSGMISEPGKSKEYYQFILSESERLSRLVNNILLLFQLEKKSNDMPLTLTAALEIIEIAKMKILPLLHESGFELKTSIDPLLHEKQALYLNQDAFVQIILNFVENSIKFSKTAEQKVIDFGVRQTGKQLEFFVRDYGPGVPKSELSKIFQLFYRGENELTRSTSGTGLGLGLSSVLAKQMNGRVEARAMNPGLECLLILSVHDSLPKAHS